MKCLVCDSEFNEPRLLKDLFRTKKFYICHKCLKKYPIELDFIYIPLEKHMLEITILFKKNNQFNFNGYTEEYSKIYESLLILNKNKLVIPYNVLYLTEEFLNQLDEISRLLDKDIIILTNILID